MADFAVTISNAVNCFGMAPTTKWNGFDWAGANWGEGTNVLLTDFTFQMTLNEAVTFSDVPAAAVQTAYGETLTPIGDNGAEYLQAGNGWMYVYPDPTTNAESRALTSFACAVAASGSWTSATAGVTPWS